MKKTLLIIFLPLLTLNLFAQNAYYDAIKLEPYARKSGELDDTDVAFVAGILKKYMPKGMENESSSDKIIRTFKEDNDFALNFFHMKTIKGGNDVRPGNSSPDLYGAIGGIDVTTIVNGLAQFMIKRSKEELTIAFFDKFKELAAKHPEFGALFPKTTNNLGNLLSYRYPEMLPALRTGFFDDIKALTYHLDDLLELPKYQALLKQLPQVAVVVRYLSVMHEIESGNQSVATVLEKIAAFPEWSQKNAGTMFSNFAGAVKLGNVLSTSLRSTDTTGELARSWIKEKQLVDMLTDPDLFRLYLALVCQQTRREEITFHIKGADVAFAKLMNTQSDNLIIFETQAREFIALARKVDTLYIDLKGKSTLTNDDYSNIIGSAIDVMNYSFSIAKLFDKDIPTDNYTKIATSINNLYRNIYKQQYSQAVANALAVLTEIPQLVESKDKDLTLKEVDSLLSVAGDSRKIAKKSFADLNSADYRLIDSLRKNYRDAALNSKEDDLGLADIQKEQTSKMLLGSLNQLSAYHTFLEDYDKVIAQIAQYAMFMANMVGAKTPEEVAAVIDGAVLPVGSSSIKKNSNFNISAQGYLGAFVLVKKADNFSGTWNDRFGVTAPIGVSFNWGFEKFGSLGLFTSLFDIGAIVDYQLKKDSVPTSANSSEPVAKKDYTVKLGQIISPGAYLVYGLFKNIPLSVGIGGQYGPGLGKVSVDNIAVVNNPRWRWNAFLAVDIPFFTLMNHQKNNKP